MDFTHTLPLRFRHLCSHAICAVFVGISCNVHIFKNVMRRQRVLQMGL